MNRREFIKNLAVATAGAASAAALGAENIQTPAKDHENHGRQKMKILVLTGSPRKKGNSATLANHFIKGAEEAGHTVERFDAAFKKVHPCIACNSCGMNGPCTFKDDFEFVRKHIIDADCVVFATPMYYFGISSQLKAVIDRFYAINGQMLKYLGWTDAGQVIAPGVWTAGSILHTEYPERAYRLGKEI